MRASTFKDTLAGTVLAGLIGAAPALAQQQPKNLLRAEYIARADVSDTRARSRGRPARPRDWHSASTSKMSQAVICLTGRSAHRSVVKLPDCGSGGRWFNSPSCTIHISDIV
jgi:hypothetical protein